MGLFCVREEVECFFSTNLWQDQPGTDFPVGIKSRQLINAQHKAVLEAAEENTDPCGSITTQDHSGTSTVNSVKVPPILVPPVVTPQNNKPYFDFMLCKHDTSLSFHQRCTNLPNKKFCCSKFRPALHSNLDVCNSQQLGKRSTTSAVPSPRRQDKESLRSRAPFYAWALLSQFTAKNVYQNNKVGWFFLPWVHRNTCKNKQ